MRVKLRVINGAHSGREVVLPVSEFLIGRGEECHLRPRSDAISRVHCAIKVSENQVTVRDLGSKNGTHVNGERLVDDRVVQAGDVIQFGPLQFEFVFEHVLGGAKRPAPKDVKEVAARAAASSQEDLDISHWLEEADDTDVSRAVAKPETRQFRLEETSQLALDTNVDGATRTGSEDSAAGTLADEADEADTKKSGRWKKSEPGKLPPRPAFTAKDSRDAAADMLRRFFNRG